MGKVKIHRLKEEPCLLYDAENQCVGKITNVLEFYDARAQIKENSLPGYYFVFKGERIDIDIKGELSHYPKGFFSKSIELLCKLV